MSKKFNLIDEPWIKVASSNLASLRDIFSYEDYKYIELAGNPIEKLAVTKLLLAIAQSACKDLLKDEETWQNGDRIKMAQQCLKYLEKNKDLFWLYSDKPFLQMPVEKDVEEDKEKKKKDKTLNKFVLGVSTGNNSRITEKNIRKDDFSDAERALILVVINGFALGGKDVDNTIILSENYSGKTNDKGKTKTGAPGACLRNGVLHSFLKGDSLLETLWLNLLTEEDLKEYWVYENGIGKAPWEEMPSGEDCEVAKKLKTSLMGKLLPMSKFYKLNGNELYYTDGIIQNPYVIDPSMAYIKKKKTKENDYPLEFLTADPAKQPWRELESLLSFLKNDSDASKYKCTQLHLCINRAKEKKLNFGIWSSGVKLSNISGEQYISGLDDFVESEILISKYLSKDYESWYGNLKAEMGRLETTATSLKTSVQKYHEGDKEQKKSRSSIASKIASKATHLFWQACEDLLIDILDACNHEPSEREKLRWKLRKKLESIYDLYCPKETARQLLNWAKNYPRYNKEKK